MVEKKDPATTATTTSNEEEDKNNNELVEAKEEEEVLLDHLIILPPLQQQGTTSSSSSSRDWRQDSVALPPLRPENPVQLLKGALADVIGYAQITNFRFVLEEQDAAASLDRPRSGAEAAANGTTSSNDIMPLLNPYTGRNAVISIPSSLLPTPDTPSDNSKDEQQVILQPWGTLQPLLSKGILQKHSALRIVLERYDASTVKDHIHRLRYLLDGNAPTMTTLIGVGGTDPPVEENGTTPESGEEGTATNGNKQPTTPEKGGKTGNAKERVYLPPSDQPIAVNAKDLEHFFYLACGEEEALVVAAADAHTDAKLLSSTEDDFVVVSSSNTSSNKSKKSKKKKGGKSSNNHNKGTDDEDDEEQNTLTVSERMRKDIPRLNELEAKAKVHCEIEYSGFHPPPPQRRLMGDLAYFDITAPDGTILCVTAFVNGFYVNSMTATDRSSSSRGHRTTPFDPTPRSSSGHCFSHSLMDCLLQANESFREAWRVALDAAKERNDITSPTSTETALQSLHRVAVRGDYEGFQDEESNGLERLIHRPSWLVPLPATSSSKPGKDTTNQKQDWAHLGRHAYDPVRMEQDITSTYGLDIHGGMQRDWNEELQQAREMPKNTLAERIDRARLIHKTMGEFGEAAIAGADAIFHGLVQPMNPNEPTRHHVYLYNNIFFSQALDSGAETFKLSRGDRAARKSASRDVASIGALHRLDMDGLYVLGTIAIEYLGCRYICQSLVPGILRGDKCHKLLYGAVESNVPMSYDEEVEILLNDNLSKPLWLANRKVPTKPLTDERLEEIEKLKLENPEQLDFPPTKTIVNDSPTTQTCVPIETKAIQGSDSRIYVMDLPRLTPRDANWVPQSEGGTGKWEKVKLKPKSRVPDSVFDDEWGMAVVRQELVEHYVRKKLAERRKAATAEANKVEEKKSEKVDGEKKKETTKTITAAEEGTKDPKTESDSSKDTPADETQASVELEEYAESLRFNVNVLLPFTRSLRGIDEEAADQHEKDAERVRELSAYLWDVMLPTLTSDIRDGRNMPVDGRNLTAILHQYGINCRYMGRLADLAIMEEKSDKADSALLALDPKARCKRKIMPLSWLEILECEMVARAAKHVLDMYLVKNRATGSSHSSQIIASFLSALVSESEETAGETENRLNKETGVPDEDDLNSLTLFGLGGETERVFPNIGRTGVWNDIEDEIGRRFRYELTIYNRNSSRANHIPLLRRVCTRSGIRLVAKSYEVGGKCLCSNGNASGGRLCPTYPISPLDIIDVVPLMKHCGAVQGEGFLPFNKNIPASIPSLHVILPEVHHLFEMANFHYNAQNLKNALDCANEAASYYQQVTDTLLHSTVIRCLDLTAAIFFDVQRYENAIATASRSLTLTVQLTGFDSAETTSAHQTLAHCYLRAGQPALGIKHARAYIYLMQLLSGKNHSEIYIMYHRVGSIFMEEREEFPVALRFFEEALRHPCSDRFMEAVICKSTAYALARVGHYKEAVVSEKRAHSLYSRLLGDNNDYSKASMTALKNYTTAAVQQGRNHIAEEKKKLQQEAADAVASQIVSDEEHTSDAAKSKSKKKRNNGRKKKK